MQIQVNFGNIPNSEAVDQHVRSAVERATEHFRDRVTRIEVHLNDQNGPKAGVDMRCMMEVRLAGQKPMAVDSVAADLYTAINDAAGKLQRAAKRHLERLNENSRTVS